MFMGEHIHSLDDKGRLIMPSRFRDQLGDRFVVTQGLDGCLYVYPIGEWEKIEEKFRQLPLNNSDVRKFTRFFFAGAAEMQLDKQGRFLIPTNLRKHARIDKEVVTVGVLSRLEIWNRQAYEEGVTYDDVDKIAENMAALGLTI